MTIIANMAASISAKRNIDQIDQLDNNTFDEFVRNRGRSGRTGSLALPNNSLLDFYDRQQEQCNSASLLLPPANTNVIRRHSSHCCPMLDETQQQHHQQLQQLPIKDNKHLQQSIKSNKNHFDSKIHQNKINKRGLSSSNTGTTEIIVVPPPPPPIPKRTFKGKFSNREQADEHHQQKPQQKRERIRGNSGRYRIDGSVSNQDSQYYNIEQTIKHQQKKPIQSFDQTNFNNYTNNSGTEITSNIIVNKPLSTLFYEDKQQSDNNTMSINNHHNNINKQDINSIMSKRQYKLISKNQHDNYDSIKNTRDNKCEQNYHNNIDDEDDDDIDGVIDDDDDCDGNSLENSVFDEPTSSSRTINCFNNTIDRNGIITSLSLINNHQQQQQQQQQHIPNNNTMINDFVSMTASPTITKLPSTNNIMNNSRHSNRSSSDSNKSQITIDTGYISSNGSEKNLTSVESRDSGGNNIQLNCSNNCGSGHNNSTNDFRSRFSSVDTQSSLDSCLTEKTIDSPLSKESFRIDSGRSSSATNNIEYNNYDLPSINTNNVNYNNKINNKNCSTIILPAVPIRKQFKNNVNNINTNNNNNRNRPIPPTPPFRSQHSIDSINCQIINQNNSIENIKNNVDNNDSNGKKFTKFNQQSQQQGSNPISFRNKFSTKNRPPPIVYHQKLHQRQDSSISSDSFSMTSSPGYNSKSMEVPLIQHTTRIIKNTKHSSENNDINDSNTNNFIIQNQQQQLNQHQKQYPLSRSTLRQDSTISSDSFSQTSSPSYNTKNMESPLLPSMKKYINTKQNFKIPNDTIQEQQDQSTPSSPIIKSTSTPASLQTVVRFQNGTSNMSLQHRIINRRKSSVPYVRDGRLKFRLLQILINALALLAIAGGLVAYFNAYPTIKFINKTIITPIQIADTTDVLADKNPAPGICLPIIVKFCQTAHVPYNYTVFPNYIGHFGQLETQVDLESYDALVDVRCYELVSLFLCTLFVPKCGSTGTTVPPCKSLCTETMRRCGFFFDVFSLSLPDYLNCNLFTDHMNPEECVGNQQVKEVREESINPTCNGFLCDQTRCIPNDWRCDGHVDCLDQTDESNCEFCDENSIYCGEKRCMSQKHMCDGTIDCPYGQDERSCIRLSERNGDIGKGFLEIYKIQDNDTQWVPACITNWDTTFSPTAICSMLGYNSVTQHQLLKLGGTNITTTLLSSQRYSPDMYRKYQKGKTNLIKEFSKCPTTGNYPVVELTCNNYECGKIRNKKYKQSKRIVGGHASNPGDWPFLAAILGGPEEIFYCAGVLIGDQWVLTASHCIGNHTLRDINDWTIQLGVTRRNSHTYYGQKVKVINVIPHPQYNTETAHDNDIALFQLAKRVAFHEHLLPVCLPPPNLTELKAGTYCTVIGWGKREDKNFNKYSSSTSSSASYELSVNEVKVPVVKREICDEWLESSNITDGMICAGYADGGKDACQGDSGGPLLCPYPGERDKWFVGGIVSWGILCAHPKLPGVYANVPKYIPWIKNEISKYSKIDNNNHNHNQYNNNNNNNNNNNKKFIDNNYYNNNKYNNIKYNNNVEPNDYN